MTVMFWMLYSAVDFDCLAAYRSEQKNKKDGK